MMNSDAIEDDDQPCTDCDGTGITKQTERRCACQPRAARTETHVQPSTKRGAVIWHCSEEDGGPDVGLSLGLGNDRLLWVGELPDRDGWGLAIYYQESAGKREDFALFDSAEAARDFFDIMERVVNGE